MKKSIKVRKTWGDLNPVERIHNPRKQEDKWIPRKALEELEDEFVEGFDNFDLEKE